MYRITSFFYSVDSRSVLIQKLKINWIVPKQLDYFHWIIVLLSNRWANDVVPTGWKIFWINTTKGSLSRNKRLFFWSKNGAFIYLSFFLLFNTYIFSDLLLFISFIYLFSFVKIKILFNWLIWNLQWINVFYDNWYLYSSEL